MPVRRAEDVRGVVLAFEGGRWVWPGIREGFERNIPVAGPAVDGQPRNLTMRTLCLDPLAFVIDGFLEKNVADILVEKAASRFERSHLATTDGDHRGNLAAVRTSSQVFIDPSEDGRFKKLFQRTARLTRLPLSLQEDFQTLRYETGQLYEAHWDYFDPRSYQNQPNFLAGLQDGRNRMVTVFWYLSDVPKGGSTFFPRAYGRGQPRDFAKCIGPSVQPLQGRALMFYSLHPNSELNPSSMHGGCRVDEGVKYAANVWTWNQAVSAVSDVESDEL